MRLLAQARNPHSRRWSWIPGSLAQRKIDASSNFVAWLTPRNDGKSYFHFTIRLMSPSNSMLQNAPP